MATSPGEHRDPPCVVYVDDEQANLTVFEAACGDRFPVLTTTLADEALSWLDEHEVAVLISDQRMPNMTGIELLEAARARHPMTVRLLVTAYSDMDVVIDGVNRGALRRYLRKPWLVPDMRADVDDAYRSYCRERDLQELRGRLLETERLYALGVATAGIAHELRNPATFVLQNLQMIEYLLSEAEGSDTAKLVGCVEDALEGATRIADIVRAIELPTRASPLDEVDVHEVATLAERMTRGHASRRVTVALDDGPWPPVRGYRSQLGQILSNLLVNAMEACRESEEPRVEVAHTVDDRRLVITVTDNGPGIPEADLDSVFRPLFSTKTKGGMGLGLAISRRIAEEHGGTLVAENAPGGGARFRLSLPLAGGENDDTARGETPSREQMIR